MEKIDFTGQPKHIRGAVLYENGFITYTGRPESFQLGQWLLGYGSVIKIVYRGAKCES